MPSENHWYPSARERHRRRNIGHVRDLRQEQEAFEEYKQKKNTLRFDRLQNIDPQDANSVRASFEQAFGGPLGAVDAENNTSVMRCNLGAPTTWAVRGTYRF